MNQQSALFIFEELHIYCLRVRLFPSIVIQYAQEGILGYIHRG